MQDSAPGLDLEQFTRWLARVRPDLAPELAGDVRAEMIAGGRSNLTYVLSAGSHRWVVRRPPLGHVLATAHDMAREFRVMTALAATDVPVPRTVALCEDTSVTGAVAYVMEHVEGRPYRTADDLASLDADRVHRIGLALVDVLVRLHEVDPGEVGLADFGRSEGFLERQVRRWRTQMDGSLRRDLPAAGILHGLLVERLPEVSAEGRVVHGDFRLDNVLMAEVEGSDRAVAVIDWEMATLGDPLTDLAMLVVYGRTARLPGGAAVADATTAPGFPTEDELLERYAAARGLSLDRLGFHLGLAAYKLAAILEGIHVRHQQGQTVGEGFEAIGAVTAPLLDLGITAIKERD